MLRLLSDENFTGAIHRGRLRRLPGLDVVRVQDVGLSQATDPYVLSWASAEQRIVLTHDARSMPNFVYERIRAGESVPGVFLVSDSMPIGQAIDEICLAAQCLIPDECKDIITYFSL